VTVLSCAAAAPAAARCGNGTAHQHCPRAVCTAAVADRPRLHATILLDGCPMAAGAWPASSTWYGESVRAHGSCWVKHGERPASMVVYVCGGATVCAATCGRSASARKVAPEGVLHYESGSRELEVGLVAWAPCSARY